MRAATGDDDDNGRRCNYDERQGAAGDAAENAPEIAIAAKDVENEVEKDAEKDVQNDATAQRRAKHKPRDGWAEASNALADSGDDALVMGEFSNADDAALAWCASARKKRRRPTRP